MDTDEIVANIIDDLHGALEEFEAMQVELEREPELMAGDD